MGKAKVIIINEKLMEYRIPIYELVAKKYDLTYVHSVPYTGHTKPTFKTREIRRARKRGPLFVHPDSIRDLCNDFDVAIVLGDIHRISFASLPFRKRKFKLAFWSIGVSTSKGFDVDKRMDWLRDFIYKKADACIFYTEYAKRRAIDKGYDPQAVFVANNTVEVLDLGEKVPKDSFLFIGALQKRKGLDVLLRSYKAALARKCDLPLLNIVGGGIEYDEIKTWVSRNDLEHKIKLVGPVYDKITKRDYFKRAYACISPSQAGLSVLESMGYGVPFVTMYNSITGGERLNIVDKETGILLHSEEEFVNCLIDIASNPKRYEEMGNRACQYYWRERKPERMAQGLCDAIEFMLTKKD